MYLNVDKIPLIDRLREPILHFPFSFHLQPEPILADAYLQDQILKSVSQTSDKLPTTIILLKEPILH